MTIRKEERRAGETRLVIDIRYRTADGRKHRFRRDAQLQTMAAAKAEERRLLVQLAQTGELRTAPETEAEPAPVYTFEDIVRHLRRVHLPQLKASTRRNYEQRIVLYLEPFFRDRPLVGLEAAIPEFAASLAADGLALSTRRGVMITLRTVVRRAVDAGLLDGMPKFPRFAKIGRKGGAPLLLQEVDRLLSVVAPSTAAAFGLAAFAGLRGGEVRALRWSDVDLRNDRLTVRRSISYGVESTPKSGQARDVPIAPPLRVLLEAIAKRRRKSGPWDPVCLTELGQPWGQTGLNQSFSRATKRAGLAQGWSFHDLRRFCGTQLGRMGVRLTVIRDILGHAEATTTERYLGTTPGEQQAAMDRAFGTGEAMAGNSLPMTSVAPARLHQKEKLSRCVT